MELHLLRTFLIVAEEKNLTRAAKRLYMTPPTISLQIKSLEEELNVVLFNRLPKGMELTEKGKLLKVKAQNTIDAAQDMVNHATELQSDLIGTLSLGVSSHISALKIKEIISEMNEISPGVDIELIPSNTIGIISDIQDNKLKAGFTFGQKEHAGIITIPLTTVELSIVSSLDNDISNMSIDELAEQPWIFSAKYCPFQALIDDFFQSKKKKFIKRVTSNDELLKKELAISGVGLTLLESFEVNSDLNTSKLHKFEIPLNLAYKKMNTEDPIVSLLKKIVSEQWNLTSE